MNTESTPNERSDVWIRLLVSLTEASPTWMAWKGVESALTGDGDVDSVAPGEAWDVVINRFADWASDEGFSEVIVCPHAPGLLHLLALVPGEELFYEVDVNRHKVFLGSTLFTPSELLPLSIMDSRGFRKLRPGSEGLFRLVHNGMSRGARISLEGIEKKNVTALLRSDPEGADLASEFFGLAAPAVRRGVRDLLAGDWNRAMFLAMEAWCIVRSIREPRSVYWRLKFRVNREHCPVLRSVLSEGRRVPLSLRDDWLAAVIADPDHQVRHLGGTEPS